MAKRKRITILGRKMGMSQLYDEGGSCIPVTLIEAGPCTVLQVKTMETDGYEALQLGFCDSKKRPRKPREFEREFGAGAEEHPPMPVDASLEAILKELKERGIGRR